MAALADVYQDSTDEDTRQCVEAALQQYDWLTTIVAQQTEERKRTIQTALESFVASPSPSSKSIQARCEGLLLLYGQDPALQEALEPVREQLKSVQSSE